jgi:pimeloyl-ACP methyl ester carboxylesterase
MADAAAERGLRTVMCARPGYGRSDPRPGRRVADEVDDVAVVLDQMGDEQFVTLGWSGGGPHALACAARMPGQCLAAASVAGVAPYRADGLDWVASMAPENLEDAPVAVWQCGQDLMVPFAHGEWLAARVPGARSHLLPGEGHLSLAVSTFGQILGELLELAGWAEAPPHGGASSALRIAAARRATPPP